MNLIYLRLSIDPLLTLALALTDPGLIVIVQHSRFPRDAVRRYEAEKDYASFKVNL